MMKRYLGCSGIVFAAGLALLAFAAIAVANLHASEPEIATIGAGDLAVVLRGHGPKPLILQVGPRVLYNTAHITGAEYAGPAAEAAGIEKLRTRVQSLPKNAAIVIYCGCCPWQHCPNIHPAYAELQKLGFRKVKALYLPNNFKTDWDDKGYPTDRTR